jgi:hypothetical protein
VDIADPERVVGQPEGIRAVQGPAQGGAPFLAAGGAGIRGIGRGFPHRTAAVHIGGGQGGVDTGQHAGGVVARREGGVGDVDGGVIAGQAVQGVAQFQEQVVQGGLGIAARRQQQGEVGAVQSAGQGAQATVSDFVHRLADLAQQLIRHVPAQGAVDLAQLAQADDGQGVEGGTLHIQGAVQAGEEMVRLARPVRGSKLACRRIRS